MDTENIILYEIIVLMFASFRLSTVRKNLYVNKLPVMELDRSELKVSFATSWVR